jgi:hypothetical protein
MLIIKKLLTYLHGSLPRFFSFVPYFVAVAGPSLMMLILCMYLAAQHSGTG